MDFAKDYIKPETKLLGAWIKPDENSDVEFKVRPYSKNMYYGALGAGLETKKIELDQIKDEVERDAEFRRFGNQKLIETFLLDWKNVSFGGEEIPFSVEKATDLIIGSEAFMDLFNKAVSLVATSVEQRDEEVEKNS